MSGNDHGDLQYRSDECGDEKRFRIERHEVAWV